MYKHSIIRLFSTFLQLQKSGAKNSEPEAAALLKRSTASFDHGFLRMLRRKNLRDANNGGISLQERNAAELRSDFFAKYQWKTCVSPDASR